jgi:hypothetical protein
MKEKSLKGGTESSGLLIYFEKNATNPPGMTTPAISEPIVKFRRDPGGQNSPKIDSPSPARSATKKRHDLLIYSK